MEFSICLCFFVFGTIFGSFYNVVGYRLPKHESILYPPSHCPKCNHRLMPWELIPILSFLLQGGKCTKCHQPIAWYYPVFEAMCGILFVLSYLAFGFTYELIIALTFVSVLIIVMVSDYYYMIISDEVLIFFGTVLLIEKTCIYGWMNLLYTIIDGAIAFCLMFLLKKFGDFLFKQESMGGGDIKLLGIFGIVLGWQNSMLAIVVGSIIGLPIAMLIQLNKKTHIIPFGPFLSVGALVVMLISLDWNWILNLLTR